MTNWLIDRAYHRSRYAWIGWGKKNRTPTSLCTHDARVQLPSRAEPYTGRTQTFIKTAKSTKCYKRTHKRLQKWRQAFARKTHLDRKQDRLVEQHRRRLNRGLYKLYVEEKIHVWMNFTTRSLESRTSLRIHIGPAVCELLSAGHLHSKLRRRSSWILIRRRSKWAQTKNLSENRIVRPHGNNENKPNKVGRLLKKPFSNDSSLPHFM